MGNERLILAIRLFANLFGGIWACRAFWEMREAK